MKDSTMAVSDKYKQVIVIRQDLEMGVGKKVAQGAHACLLAAEEARRRVPDLYREWYSEGMRKIACKVSSEAELQAVYEKARQLGIPTSIVADAGLTQLTPGTITAVGVGPARSIDIDKVTGTLKLL